MAMNLAELIEEGRELRGLYESAEEEGLDSTANDYWNQLCTFWDNNGPRLLAVAEAAVKMRKHSAVPDHWCPEYCTFCESIAAFDAAASGEAPK